MKSLKRIIRVALFLCICLLFYILAYLLLKPETSILDGRNETGNINYKGFDNLEDNVLDYAAVGSSNIFMDVNPASIWNSYGYTGYNLASPEQRNDTSLYYVKQIFKTQSPKVIFMDSYSIGEEESTGLGYTHIGLDYFPLSKEKSDWIESQNYTENVKTDFYNPFIQYHSRWGEVKRGDYKLLRYDETEDFLGYAPSYQKEPCKAPLMSNHVENFVISSRQEEIIQQIAALCEKNGAKLVLVKTPNIVWTKEHSEEVGKLAQRNGVNFIEFNDKNIVDIEKDFCDAGLHLNYVGAGKVSDYLGQYMKDNFELKDKGESNGSVSQYFDKRSEHLEQFGQSVQLSEEKDWKKYWKSANDKDYVIMLSATRDEETKEILDDLVTIPNDNGEDMAVSFMLDGGETVNYSCNSMTEEAGLFTMEEYGHIFYVETGGLGVEIADSKIQMDYQNYSMGKKINIVVYDKEMDIVVDSSNITRNEEGEVELEHYRGE